MFPEYMKNEKALLSGKAAHVCRFTSKERKFIDDAPDLTIYFIVDSNILIHPIHVHLQKPHKYEKKNYTLALITRVLQFLLSKLQLSS